MKKEDLKHNVTEIIRQIGKYRNGKWKFNLDKLLERWEKCYPKKKFKSFGFGNLHTFLTKELEITDLGSREFSLSGNENKIANGTDEKTDVLLKPEKNQTAKGDGPSDGATSAGQPKKEYGENLKLDIVIIVKDLSGKDGNKSSENFDISLELLWRSLKEKKVDGNFGSSEELRQFLIGHCFVDFKEIGQTHPSENEILSFNKKAIREYLKSCGIGEECCIQEEEIQQPESERETTSSIAIDRPRPVPSEATEKQHSCPENPQMRFIQLVCVMYHCGLEALRNVFLRFHPGLNNTTRDVAQFKRGNLRVDDFEKERFESGDINQWDITLICKVLLFSNVSSAKLKTEEFRGYEDAIKSLRNIKNKFISHKSNPKLTTREYTEAMNCMQNSLTAIGLPEDQFLRALEDADISTDNLYYAMYLEEIARSLTNTFEAGNKSLSSQLESGHKKLSTKVTGVEESVEGLRNEIKNLNDLVERIQNKQIFQHEIPAQAAKQDPAKWDEWLKVKTELNNFDADSNQYILIVDKLHPSDASYLTALGNIPWKLVLDLDPDSDINGLLKKISPLHENSGIIVTHTPSQLRQRDRAIDFKRVQWVFANGRNQDADEDKPKEKFEDWRRRFKTPVCNLINNCSLKLDPSKPVFCVVLNLQNSSTTIAKSLVEEIDNMFPLNDFKLKFMFFTPEFDLEKFTDSCYSNLSTKFLFLGISAQLGRMNDTFQLPSAQEGVPVPLPSKKYHFLSEYLEILHKGCENIPKELPEKEKKKFERHHLKSFLKGNLISCESLEYDHDCARSITKQITSRIQKMCSRKSSESTSQIVQISHSPGTGGSTIARRVLWDLHLDYPCAIVKMGRSSDSFATECDGDQSFITNLSDRIGELEEACEVKPIILIDGNSRQVRNISDHLVRKLNADGPTAIILRAVYPQGDKKENDNYFPQRNNFEVKSVLEDNDQDLQSFRKSYNYYDDIFDKHKLGHKTVNNLTRVFHFPMMAMLGDFEKLEGIVKQSLDIVKREHPHEYEVAVLVAFLQIYANCKTPISLIEKYLQTKLTVKDGSKHLFSEDLLCLMVSKKAPNKKKWIGYQNFTSDVDSDYSDDYDSEEDDFYSSNQGVELCTFQHLKVAEIVIKHSERDLDDLTGDFVKLVVEENNNKNRFRDLINDLFLYNKEATDKHFSCLVMKLKNGGRIFEEAAKKTKDAAFYSHVARYYAWQETPPDFQKAKDLIKEGLKVDKYATKEKTRGVRDAEGHILLREMKYIKESSLTDVEKLETYAKKAISCFRRARDNPPMTYPNPLMGEVNVWQFCFDWIIRWKKADVEAAIAYMMEEEFFETAIADCFYLLDQIDSIVQSVPWLVAPTHTMMLANESRMSLMQVLGTTKGKTGRKANVQSVNIAQLCEEICSKKNFKNANEKEITRLRVSWMMNQAGKDIHLLDKVDRPVLLRRLEKLVLEHGAYEYAHNLMTVSTIQDKDSYTLERALEIVKEWQKRTPHDAFSFFYEYIISFLCVLNGSIIHFRSPYQLALEACNKKCESNHRKFIKRYCLAKDRDTEKLCCLISPSELEKLCNEDRSSNKQKQKPSDHHPERKHLLECHGRVRLHTVRGKQYPHIALEQGNLKIGVEKNSLGKPHQDFTPDSKVSFFVYFTLDGPRAKDIRFDNAASSSSKLSRQISKKGKE